MVAKRPPRSTRSSPSFDADNGYKAITDCITKAQTHWKDDDQVTVAIISKRFTNEDEQPHVKVSIFEEVG